MFHRSLTQMKVEIACGFCSAAPPTAVDFGVSCIRRLMQCWYLLSWLVWEEDGGQGLCTAPRSVCCGQPVHARHSSTHWQTYFQLQEATPTLRRVLVSGSG